jgi:hypothetical protein
MAKTKLKIMLSSIIAISLLTGIACARGNTYVIKGKNEAVEKVNLQPPDSMKGNVSVQDDGLIDFYITNPSGEIIFGQIHVSYAEFNFTSTESGNYTLHLANPLDRNVTVLLSYSLAMFVVLHENVNVSADMTTMIIGVGTPIDWTQIIEIGFTIGIFVARFVREIAKAIGDFFYRLWWYRKYRKPRTPSDASSNLTQIKDG